MWRAGLDKLAAAVDRACQALPQELRRDVEFRSAETRALIARANRFRWTVSSAQLDPCIHRTRAPLPTESSCQ